MPTFYSIFPNNQFLTSPSTPPCSITITQHLMLCNFCFLLHVQNHNGCLGYSILYIQYQLSPPGLVMVHHQVISSEGVCQGNIFSFYERSKLLTVDDILIYFHLQCYYWFRPPKFFEMIIMAHGYPLEFYWLLRYYKIC